MSNRAAIRFKSEMVNKTQSQQARRKRKAHANPSHEKTWECKFFTLGLSAASPIQLDLPLATKMQPKSQLTHLL
jgi:hypothetical protein